MTKQQEKKEYTAFESSSDFCRSGRQSHTLLLQKVTPDDKRELLAESQIHDFTINEVMEMVYKVLSALEPERMESEKVETCIAMIITGLDPADVLTDVTFNFSFLVRRLVNEGKLDRSKENAVLEKLQQLRQIIRS